MKFLPAVKEEREIAAESRVIAATKRGWIVGAERKQASAALAPEWRRTSLLLRFIGFVTGLVLATSLFGLCKVFELQAGILTAAGAIAAAEFLILKRHFWKSGIEEALWIAGLFAVVLDLPGPAVNEGLLLFAAASLVAAIRLLHPWFAAASIAFVAAYVQSETGNWATVALLYGVAAFAIVMLARTWRSPMVESLASIAAVAGAPAAYVLLKLNDVLPGEAATAAGFATAAIFCGVGLLLRHHAPLFGGLLTLAIVVGDFAAGWPIRPEWRWLLCGFVALAGAQTADRLLRARTNGVTARREPDIEALETLQALSVTSVTTGGSGPEPSRGSGGGGFGGGGASGDY